jgi:hypothetical protein
LNIKKEKIERIIRECEQHALRMEDSAAQMGRFMPLESHNFQDLSKLQVQIIDQFLFRFAKLQDSLGEKLFKAILLFLDEDIANKPFIDILNKMEKLELLTSAQEWRDLRDIRNELSHTYSDDSEEMTLAINKTFTSKDILITIFKKIKDYYHKV